MFHQLDKLASIGSAPLLTSPPAMGSEAGAFPDEDIRDLTKLLRRKNGFYAFESALHVFPAGRAREHMDLQRWNAEGLWRSAYGHPAEGCLFFAEDVFGGQFCLHHGGVWSFDPETGQKEWVARTLEEWADVLLGDYEFLTGYPIAREWQAAEGPLQPGQRLVPRRPFVLGGDYSVDNLYAMDATESMIMRAELATRIGDLPDGATVRYEVGD